MGPASVVAGISRPAAVTVSSPNRPRNWPTLTDSLAKRVD